MYIILSSCSFFKSLDLQDRTYNHIRLDLLDPHYSFQVKKEKKKQKRNAVIYAII